MTKKLFMPIAIFIGLVLMLTINVSAADDSLTVTDSTDDVSQYDYTTAELIGTYPLPSIDIAEIKAERTGDTVTITLTLADDGEIEKDQETAYGAYLFTTSPSLIYLIAYTGIDLGEELGFGSDGFLVIHGEEDVVQVESSSVEDNVMSLSFKLDSSDERLIGLYATTSKEPAAGNYSYADEAPDGVEESMMSLTPSAGGIYNATTGTPISFQATLEEGSPDDYEWVWVFEETGTTLTGKNPSNTFKIPDTYAGIVYVFDGEGKWGYDEFSVKVTGNKIDGDSDNNGSPGFEIIVMFLAIAVIAGIAIYKRK